MKHAIRFTLAALAPAAALLSTNAPAHADYDFSKVADPRIPNPIMFWCMGGGAGNLLLGQPGYCDGEHYPDGSYWHVINAPVVRMRMDCVIDNGSPLPPLAPPGGCGGAVTQSAPLCVPSSPSPRSVPFSVAVIPSCNARHQLG